MMLSNSKIFHQKKLKSTYYNADDLIFYSSRLQFRLLLCVSVIQAVLKVNTEVLHTTRTSYLYQLYSTTLPILLWDKINLNFNSLFDIASLTDITDNKCEPEILTIAVKA